MKRSVFLKKLLIGILASLILLTIAIPCNAAANIPIKSDIPIIIINNLIPEDKIDKGDFMDKSRHDVANMLCSQATKSLDRKYCVVELKSDQDINDLASTEKPDLLAMFKNTKYKIAIFAEILPLQSDTPFFYVEDRITVHIKILDITNQKYLYNGKITNTASTPRRAMPEINKQLDKILTNTLMK
jgi:hypothetical protein